MEDFPSLPKARKSKSRSSQTAVEDTWSRPKQNVQDEYNYYYLLREQQYQNFPWYNSGLLQNDLTNGELPQPTQVIEDEYEYDNNNNGFQQEQSDNASSRYPSIYQYPLILNFVVFISSIIN